MLLLSTLKYSDKSKAIIVFLIITFSYIVGTILCTYPAMVNISKPIGPPEDNQMFIWNIWWFKFALVSLHTSPFFTNYLFYPEGANLHFHTYSPLNNLMAIIIEPFFGLTITYNILLLLTLITAAIGMYYLLKYYKLSNYAAFIGGIIFSFNPFHLSHLSHHLNISSIHFIPFLILLAAKYLDTNKIKYLILSAIVLAANFYLDYYVFLFGLVLLVAMIPFKSTNNDLQIRSKLIHICYLMILALVLMLPLLIPMISEISSGHFPTISGQDYYVIDLTGFFFPHKYHWTGSSIVNNFINLAYKGNYWESAAFLGYFVLPLAIWAAFKAKIKFKVFLIIVGIGGAILSLGSTVHIFGLTIPFLKLPIYFLEKIPGLNAARSPSRFIFLTYFSISVLAAYSADVYLKYIRRNFNQQILIAIVTVICLGVMADYWTIPFKSSDIPIPRFYESIKVETDTFAILNLPQAGWDCNERYMYHQTIHQKPICNGQLARSGDEYFEEWKNVPLDIPTLTKKKVKYIALYSEFLESKQYSKSKLKYSNDFKFVAEECGIALFKVY